MPQPSISYACGRVGVLGRAALKSSQLDRLQSTHTYDEALRTLTDIGFAAADQADFQAVADAHVRAACELIHAITPCPEITDSFQLRYDANNLKVLIKSRQLAQKAQYLSACGTIPVEKLRHAVSERSYASLPKHLRDGLNALEKRIAVQFDPMLVDTELDRAMYRQVFENLSKHKQATTAKQYFQAKVDFQNLMMVFRLRNMGRDESVFMEIALEGGTIPVREMRDAFTDNERLSRKLFRYRPSLAQAALLASMDAAKLPNLEKLMEDYLFGLLKPYRYAADATETLFRYLLQKQREATDIRLVMAGKLNGFQPGTVAERMRELDG